MFKTITFKAALFSTIAASIALLPPHPQPHRDTHHVCLLADSGS